ncbi:oligoribonuclease [Candidatus Kinetoplastibacterium blastocrithidii TCC012E]|uniref:Oligoribonuclease n=1 Tax=Candidatus Kinetoplastidibacterium blastocrithidiae TCC012E TaxID=1208922 RepID=M1MDP5_9PROT|nr:oligoribonuclease [Candidatus Kinetoplastibacterium blastocrithidii]AFZ83722.1 oligoribonuclease [Candidatus Kinetoplastibacterium blastocrithidii (ex Strigomonas culicis)]AGF49845.1 oligoribonuclease [Candidatus Kinetoplastibacterium blastocrithidii TCC012E]
MNINNNRLVWLDMEMSGLDPLKDKILEVAVVITDENLDEIIEGPVIVIHQTNEILESMDKWNKSVHSKSGLVDKVLSSEISEKEAEDNILLFLENYINSGVSPLCGNTISQDRRFMNIYMSRLEKFFHYRNIDVSSIKELAKRWSPNAYKNFSKNSKHQALSDIYDSINELRYYRKYFFKL